MTSDRAVRLEAPPAAGAGEDRLLGFYDAVRRRVERAAERSAGPRLAEALLLVPDVLLLLVRLTLDREVPAASRRLLGGALLYFVVPFDLLPEAVVGGAGYVDDLILASAVLAEAFGTGLEPWAERHWSGSRRLREVLADATRAADALLGADLAGRLRRLLARRGVRLRG